jgi:hypothetical protein
VEVPLSVLTAITPQGISDVMRRQMGELLLDTVALPGKLVNSCEDGTGGGTGDDGEVLSQLTVAISGLTQVGEGEAGRGIGDAGWKNSSRTACASIKSLKTLVDTERLVRSMERMLFRGLDGSCTQILVVLDGVKKLLSIFLTTVVSATSTGQCTGTISGCLENSSGCTLCLAILHLSRVR